MKNRRVYIEPVPLPDALRLWEDGLISAGAMRPLGSETVKVGDSVGRVTAEGVHASMSSPFYHSAAMDGFAVKASDTFTASDSEPLGLRLGEQAHTVDTGDPLPDGTDAVIMIEDTDEPEEGVIEIVRPATPWQHVRAMGEDIVKTELVVSSNHLIRPMDAAAMLSAGVTEVAVRRRPLVAVIPTGDELVPPGGQYEKGDIIEFNSTLLSGMARSWGAEAKVAGIVPDDPDRVSAALGEALKYADMVVINAGSSAGREDYTHHAISVHGEVFVDGVAIKPGKPVILGAAGGKPVLGIPGFPVAAAVTFGMFGKTPVYAMQGVRPPKSETASATLGRQLSSTLGVDEFVKVKLGRVGEGLVATPLPRGSGRLMSLVRADGIVRINAEMEGLAAGTLTDVELLRHPDEIEGTVVCIGSHDNALDLLSDRLKQVRPQFGLSSAHVGSLGGLMALKRGEAHMAGCHLLDEESGTYNIPYIEKHLAGMELSLVNLVYRSQGLMVLPGNPKNINGISDLGRDDVRFVNRQRGAGTRILLDLELKRTGIRPEDVQGYETEEYTHMGVAVAVASGKADAGLGILAAANALGLDFLPVAEERYDLVIPAEHINLDSVSALLDVIRRDSGFREAVESLGGYDTRDMGRVMHDTGSPR